MPPNPNLRNGVYSSSYLRSFEGEGNFLLVSPATKWIGWQGSQRIYSNAYPYLREAAKRFRAKTGRALTVLEVWRSYDTQVEYKRRQNAGTGNPAATPGTSNHGYGVAFDLASGIDSWTSAEHRAFVEVATPLGFTFPLDGRNGQPNEPWHAEWDSSRVTSNDWAGSGAVPIDQEDDDVLTPDQDAMLRALYTNAPAFSRTTPLRFITRDYESPWYATDGLKKRPIFDYAAARLLVDLGLAVFEDKGGQQVNIVGALVDSIPDA